MDKSEIFSEKFVEVLKHEGVVSIVSWGASDEPHVVNTWNSYIVIADGNRLFIPAYGMRKTEKNVVANNKVKITLGTREVLGYKDYQGTGFLVEGTAKYLDSGSDYEFMKEKFSFLTRVIEVTVISAKQTI